MGENRKRALRAYVIHDEKDSQYSVADESLPAATAVGVLKNGAMVASHARNALIPGGRANSKLQGGDRASSGLTFHGQITILYAEHVANVRCPGPE
jgi:hypothetical protein